jgi:PAS domain S-box-containing protein
MPPPGEPPHVLPRGLFIAAILLFIVIIATGIIFYQSQEQQIKDRVTHDLTAIATLKADQIALWREDRLFDARVISAGAFFTEGGDHFLTYGDDESREKILSRFREMNASPHYDNALLVDPQGNVHLSLDPAITSLHPSVKTQINKSLERGTATLTDFHRIPGTGQIRMEVVAPLILKTDGSEKPVGAVVLSIDPDEFLYRLVQSWPVPSDTAETLLVEPEGDNVLFLSELRHQNNTALNLTIPLSQTDIPAVMAVKGITGAFEGRDYRGIDVISVLEPIPGSPWFMVTKVDTEEAYSSWRTRSLLIIALVAGTLAGAFIIVVMVWQRRQKYYYRTLYTAESERRDEEQRNRERSETLLRLAEMETASEQELADFVLDAGCRLSDSSLAFIGVMSTDESVFDITAWSKSVMNDCSVAASPIHFPIEKAGIWAEAVRQRKPFIVNDYPASQAGKKGLPSGHVPITRFASVPIFEGQRMVMVCAVANKEAGYTAADVDNLTLLMQGVWTHVRKRSAEEALRRKTSDLEAAYEEITASDEELASNYEELAKSQQALAESERKYRELFENITSGFALHEILLDDYKKPIDYRFLMVNPAFERLTGLKSADIINRTVLDVLPGTEPYWIEKYGQVALVGVPERFEHFSREINKWFEVLVYSPKHAQFATVINDITERVRAEEALRNNERELDALFESMINAFALFESVFDDNGTFVSYRFIRINDAYERITGVKNDEVRGKTVHEVWPETEESWVRAYGEVAVTGKPSTFDMYHAPTKKLYHCNVYRPGESTDRFCVVFEDITERRAAEEKIITSETRYRRLFESAKDGILILNRDTGAIMDANPFIESLLGYTPGEIIGKYLWDIGIFKNRILSKIAFEDLKAAEYQRYEDLPLETKDGQLKEVEFISNVYSIDQTSVIQCNIRDITDRKVMERQREALITELEQKNAELERFTYTVSHDLKSPLITIRGFAGLLEDDTLKGDPLLLKKDIRRITEAAETMQDLLADLLELSRIGRIANPPETIPFGTIAREAVDMLAGPLAERDITVEIAPDLPDVGVDHVRIREVMINLIENAIKFIGDQKVPLIRIGVDTAGATPVFFVKDNGIGIAPQYLERIFNLFEKLDASQHSTGIGLTIARRIIEVHGGKIWAESEGPGMGTTFRFTLPEPADEAE